jgi:flagellar basal body P-ring formation protein FlgA
MSKATRRTLALLLASVGLGFCATAAFVLPALAQQPTASRTLVRPVMKSDVVVARDIITLGDVLDHAGSAADTAVFRAPALGRSGTIQATRIAEAALAAGLPAIDTALVSQVVVTRAARKIMKAEMEEAVRKALAGRYGLDQADVNLALEGNETTIFVEPEAAGELRVQDLVLDARNQHLEATIAVAGSRALTLKPLRVAGQVVDTIEVPVLARGVARGEQVRPSDIRLERRPRTEVAQSGFVDMSALTGRIARSTLQAGTLVREADLAKQEVVGKNDMVTVTYETPGLQLAMRGKAMESGGVGDIVLVQNLQSKRTLQGTIVGAGRISVSLPTPGPVASAGPVPVTP